MPDSRDREVLTGEHPDHVLVAESDKDSSVPAAVTLAKGLLGVCCFYQDLFWKWEVWSLKNSTTSQGNLMIEQLGFQHEATSLQDLVSQDGALASREVISEDLDCEVWVSLWEETYIDRISS